jgi:hypothetical protein
MARRKGESAKPTSGEAKSAEKLNDEQLQALFFQHKQKYENSLALKKKADADFKNACKLIKAEGTSIDDIQAAIEMDTEEGEARIKAGIQSKIRVARWMGASIGTQFEIFEDRTPAADRAYDEGKRAGMKAEARKPPYDPSTEQSRKWFEGYDAGQAVNAAGIKPKSGGAAARVAAEAGDAHIKGLIGDQKPSHTVHQ